MKEINDIISAYRTAVHDNIRMTLATVVKVEGSSYRQPGARMLVTEDGRLTGAISGGCLEGDALRKALLAIHQQQNKLITYDTNEEGSSELGVQLGCNGIVHILFEHIDSDDPFNPIALLEQLRVSRKESVLVTLFSLEQRKQQIGTSILKQEDVEIFKPTIAGYHLLLSADMLLAKQKRQNFLKSFDYQGQVQEALIEYISSPISLIIAGAGNDAKPMVEAASLLGWETTILDGRATHALQQRFPKAQRVLLASPDQAIEQLQIDSHTVFVLMTHNYKYDLSLLQYLVKTATPYIGVLGPKTKLQRMLDDVSTAGIILSETQKICIYGPMGLDIGAETSEEIAFSTISEIKAVLSNRKAGFLKNLTTKIHENTPIIT